MYFLLLLKPLVLTNPDISGFPFQVMMTASSHLEEPFRSLRLFSFTSSSTARFMSSPPPLLPTGLIRLFPQLLECRICLFALFHWSSREEHLLCTSYHPQKRGSRKHLAIVRTSGLTLLPFTQRSALHYSFSLCSP